MKITESHCVCWCRLQNKDTVINVPLLSTPYYGAFSQRLRTNCALFSFTLCNLLVESFFIFSSMLLTLVDRHWLINDYVDPMMSFYNTKPAPINAVPLTTSINKKGSYTVTRVYVRSISRNCWKTFSEFMAYFQIF